MKFSNLHKIWIAVAVQLLIFLPIVRIMYLKNTGSCYAFQALPREINGRCNSKDARKLATTYQYHNFSAISEEDAEGYMKHVFQSDNGYGVNNSETIILASVASKDAFGGHRKLPDFLEVLHSLNYDCRKLSLAIYFKDYTMLNDALVHFHGLFLAKAKKNFNRVTLVYSTFVDDTMELAREDRHADDAQRARRRNIARSRNFLYNIASDDELYTLHIDSDVTRIPADFLNAAINSEKAILVPRILRGGCTDYDRNSWNGPRTRPSDVDFSSMDTQEPEMFYVPNPTHETKFLADYIDAGISENSEEAYSYLVQLDSVGGAVLFVKSVVLQLGVQFPPFMLIGTEWSRAEGYDGIETEGLCYAAKIAGGFECFGFPMITANHYDD